MRKLIQHRLDGESSDIFKFVFSVLHQAALFSLPGGYDLFLTLVQYENLQELSTTLRVILQSPLLNELNEPNIQTFFCQLINHYDITSLNHAFIRLANQPNQLLVGRFATIILKAVLQHNAPLGISCALSLLNEYDVLSGQSIDLVAIHPHPMLLTKQLTTLLRSGISPLFFKEIILGALESPSASNFCENIQGLHINKKLRTVEIVSLRMNRPVSELTSDEIDYHNLRGNLASFRAMGSSFFSSQRASTDSLFSAADIDSASSPNLDDLLRSLK